MKRLIVEIGVWVLSVRRIEPEWATDTVWIDGHWVASATTSAPSGATPVGCGWADFSTIARRQIEVEKAWEPLLAALRYR